MTVFSVSRLFCADCIYLQPFQNIRFYFICFYRFIHHIDRRYRDRRRSVSSVGSDIYHTSDIYHFIPVPHHRYITYSRDLIHARMADPDLIISPQHAASGATHVSFLPDHSFPDWKLRTAAMLLSSSVQRR